MVSLPNVCGALYLISLHKGPGVTILRGYTLIAFDSCFYFMFLLSLSIVVFAKILSLCKFGYVAQISQMRSKTSLPTISPAMFIRGG